ncbi:2-oxoacid:acceptor oxidoreductase family protein [Salmonella enterica]|uniref:2-oxoacid:acceptor oxidoreductase family protein n=1 Tax=Salmonella enterica TaxID=28901 RepID=UPI0021D4A4C8|nr:2-oxoacid:acceptor oxidoreductase family protein [Salmonella enterica]HAU7017756.1 pyruvate ferredoxin oxidoreductase [Salmonella enterica subsp. enterica serovar Broughton]
MKYKCAFSGSGGQGAGMIAKLICLACIKDEKQVVMTQTYGIEQRGGDSTGYVVLSDEVIGSPIVESDADIGVALSESVYQNAVEGMKPGGKLFINSSLIETQSEGHGVKQIAIPASELAQEIGDIRVANIILLGAIIGKTKMLKPASIISAIEEILGKKKPALLEINIAALNKGLEIADQEAVYEQ